MAVVCGVAGGGGIMFSSCVYTLLTVCLNFNICAELATRVDGSIFGVAVGCLAFVVWLVVLVVVMFMPHVLPSKVST